nr:hypothetical protein [uncultured Allomuricauda sp.]
MRNLKMTTLVVSVFLLTVQSSCSKEDDNPTFDSTQERLFMATKNTPYNPFTGTGGLKNYFLVLLPDGTAYNGLPRESTLGLLTRAELINENSLRVGEYEENGNQLVIRWTFNQNKVWTLQKESGGWRQNSTKKYEPIKPNVTSGTLDATYVFEHTGASGFPGIGLNTFGVRDEIQFNRDGTYTRLIVSGASSDGGVGTNGFTDIGTYNIEGYALSLKSNQGTTLSFTIFKWPGEESTVLALNGKRFQKLQ